MKRLVILSPIVTVLFCGLQKYFINGWKAELKKQSPILLLLFSFLIIFSACGGDSPIKHEDPGTVWKTTLPDQIGGISLQGFIEEITPGPFTTYSGYDGNVQLTFPTAASIRIDGYVQVTGINSGYNTMYISVYRDGEIKSLLPVSMGSFSEYIYFRESGEQQLKLYYKENDLYYTIAVIDVTNEPSGDIKYLVASTEIQAFDPEIRILAKEIIDSLESPADESIALAFHDYIVKLIYYDFDSLVPGERKDQDALSVLANGCAVCEGYSTLYSALLRASGIPVQVYTGNNHAWNLVYWSGEWHDVDVTWDDPYRDDGSGTCVGPPDYDGCTSDFPGGDNLRYNYFDTDFNGDVDHNGTVEDYYKK
ncbi:transglutaminase domain-containing protein [Spirochaetota bacterium]